MKRALAFALPLSFAHVLGCTPAQEPDGVADEVGDSDSDSATEDGESTGETSEGESSGEESTSTTGAEVIATIAGVVTDSEGAPLPAPNLQFCGPIPDSGVAEACLPVPIEADGSFAIDVTKAGPWNVKFVHGPTDDRDFTGQALLMDVQAGDAIDLGAPPVVVPELTEITDLSGVEGETTVDIEGGLSLTFDPANTQTLSFTAATELGGVFVDPAHWGVVETPTGQVVAAWAFAPFGTKAIEGAFEVTLDDSLGLEPGQTVTLYEIIKDNGWLREVGAGVVTGEGILLTPSGEGLHELSWLLVSL